MPSPTENTAATGGISISSGTSTASGKLRLNKAPLLSRNVRPRRKPSKSSPKSASVVILLLKTSRLYRHLPGTRQPSSPFPPRPCFTSLPPSGISSTSPLSDIETMTRFLRTSPPPIRRPSRPFTRRDADICNSTIPAGGNSARRKKEPGISPAVSTWIASNRIMCP